MYDRLDRPLHLGRVEYLAQVVVVLLVALIDLLQLLGTVDTVVQRLGVDGTLVEVEIGLLVILQIFHLGRHRITQILLLVVVLPTTTTAAIIVFVAEAVAVAHVHHHVSVAIALHERIVPASLSPLSIASLALLANVRQLSVPILRRGPLHEQQARQYVDEDPAHPRRHDMRGGRAEVNIEHHHGDADRQCHQDHGEEQILAEQRNHQTGGRNDLGQQQEEHGERDHDRDGKTDLLARLRGQVEDEHGEEGDAHARNDQIDRVEQGLASHRQLERNVRVGDVLVDDHVVLGRHHQYVPLDALVEFAHVDAHRHLVLALLLLHVPQVHLVAIVSPAAELKFILVDH